MAIGDDLAAGIGSVGEFLADNPVGTAVGAGVVGVGLGAGAVALLGGSSKTKTKRSRRSIKRDRRFKSKQKHEQRYKRKRKYKIYGKKGWIHPKRKGSKRRGKVFYARKTGQPYIILASGKAKFIKGKRRK